MGGLRHQEPAGHSACPLSPTSRIASERRTLLVRYTERIHGIMEDAMRLQLRCHGDIDLSQPGMQVENRSHIERCLRDSPQRRRGG